MQVNAGKKSRIGFSKRLKAFLDKCEPKERKQKSWLRAELHKFGIKKSVQAIGKWLDGRTFPRETEWEILAKILRCRSVNELRYGDENPAPQTFKDDAALSEIADIWSQLSEGRRHQILELSRLASEAEGKKSEATIQREFSEKLLQHINHQWPSLTYNGYVSMMHAIDTVTGREFNFQADAPSERKR